ncbi:WD40 repeat-containing protein [Artemisia annua]|uniref:WD40 repeat-containing protein n=1 Tax=Artemisia annua TaxID=35608 RepID=A0A2U1KSB3_ARTAN|nr:WD40 repeat-containing protein [Artemisia annua]
MDDNVVVPFDFGSPESCVEDIKNVREELAISRVTGSDVNIRYQEGGRRKEGLSVADWTSKLGKGLASLIVMTLESVRSFWIDFDYSRLLTDHRYATREVSGPEGGVMLGWGQASTHSRLAMEISGVIWRSSPLEDEDLVALGNDPIYARDCVALLLIYYWRMCSRKKQWGVEHQSSFNPESERARNTRRELLSWVEAESLQCLTAKYCQSVPSPRSTIAAAFSADTSNKAENKK